MIEYQYLSHVAFPGKHGYIALQIIGYFIDMERDEP